MSRFNQGHFHGYNVEDMLECSGDGLENRLIAKDFLYKLEDVLRAERGRGLYLKSRIKGYHNKAVAWSVRKRAKDLWQQI